MQSPPTISSCSAILDDDDEDHDYDGNDDDDYHDNDHEVYQDVDQIHDWYSCSAIPNRADHNV